MSGTEKKQPVDFHVGSKEYLGALPGSLLAHLPQFHSRRGDRKSSQTFSVHSAPLSEEKPAEQHDNDAEESLASKRRPSKAFSLGTADERDVDQTMMDLHQLQIIQMREKELMSHWVTGSVVVTEAVSQKRDLEVYKYALCCAEPRLSPERVTPEAERKQNRVARKNSMPITRSMLEVILEAVAKEIPVSDGQPLYLASLRSFQNDLRKRQDEMLRAQVSVVDLMNLFSEIVSKEKKSVEKTQVSSDAEASVVKFGSIIAKALKVKRSKFQAIVAEDSQQESLTDFLSDVFQVSRAHRADIIPQITFAQSQKGSFLEMATNLALIDCHSYYNLASFPTREMLDAWKTYEMGSVHSLLQKIDPSAYRVFDTGEGGNKRGNPWIRIKVVKAKDLTSKGANSKPYCMVDFAGESYETSPATQVRNPSWDEQVTLPIKSSSGTIVIQVKSKVQEESSGVFSKRFWTEDSEHFLGQVSLSIEEIEKRGPLPWEGWFPLQKRSRRSHVTGEIYLSIQNLPPAAVDFEKTVHAEKPAVVHSELYKYLLRAFLKYDTIHGGQPGELSSKSQQILREYALRYRVGPLFQATTLFGMLVELHNTTKLNVNLLQNAYQAIQDAYSRLPVRTKDEEAMYELAMLWSWKPLLRSLTQYRENFPLAKPAGSIEASIKLLFAYENDPVFQKVHFTDLKGEDLAVGGQSFGEQIVKGIKKEMQERAAKEVEDLVSKTAPGGLINYAKLVNNLMDLLEEDKNYFEKPFSTIPGFSVSMKGTIKFGARLKQFAEEEIERQFSSPDINVLSNIIAFYHKLLEFKEEWIDNAPASDTNALQWEEVKLFFVQEGPFSAVFRKWVDLVEVQMSDWIQRALQVDNFEPIGGGSLHSTSIVDCFSAFDQAASFLSQIRFQNQALRVHLWNLFAGNVTKLLQSYFATLYSDSVSQFQVITKSRYSIFHSSKVKYALPYEISAQNLVKLNNLEAARKYLHQLYDNIDVDTVLAIKEILPEISLSKEALHGSEGFTGTLQLSIVMATGLMACDSNGRSDPYAVVMLGDRVIAKTRTIEKTLNPKWEEKFEVLVQDAKELTVCVYDKDLFRVDDLCGRAVFSLENLMDGHIHDVNVELEPQGIISLRIRLEVTGIQDIGYCFSFMFKYLKHQTTDFIRLFMEQMSPFFKESCRKLLSDTKSSTGLLGWTELDPMDQAQQALKTLMQYLESNIPVLTMRLYPTVSVNVLKKTWKEVLKAMLVTLLPNIEEDVASKLWFSPKRVLLTPRQVSVISSSVEVLRDFFDAKGLEGKDLKNHVLGEVMLAVELYGKPTRVLIKRYLASLEEDLSEKEARNRYIILHVLQLQDDAEAKKFVEDMLKDSERERKWTSRRDTVLSESSSEGPSNPLLSPPVSPLLPGSSLTRQSS